MECPLESNLKVPRPGASAASAWHASARLFHFPGFVSQTARPGRGRATTTTVTEKSRGSSRLPLARRTAGRAKPQAQAGRRGPQAQSPNLPVGPAERRRLGTGLTRSGPLAAPSLATKAGNCTEVAPQPQAGLLAPGH